MKFNEMRSIFFVRHAKSSWVDISLSDADRPLNSRGHRDAPYMAKKLAGIIPSVDLMICSPARRAQETSTYFTHEIKSKKKETIDKVYHASIDTLLDVIMEIDPSVRTAMIFGHNPGFTMVYDHFAKRPIDNLPTCGIFQIMIDGEWADSDTTNSAVGHLLYPKMFIQS